MNLLIGAFGALRSRFVVFHFSDSRSSPTSVSRFQPATLSGSAIAFASRRTLNAMAACRTFMCACFWMGCLLSTSVHAATPGISAGRVHTVGLKSDGTVLSWGEDSDGQLGIGRAFQFTSPIRSSGISGATAISAGDYHTVALKSDGTAWAWGDSSRGQLGDGTTIDRPTPVLVSGLTDVAAIAAGSFHTVALKRDGTVWAWGGNFGALGDGTNTDKSTTPVQASGLTGVIAIAAGGGHTVALKGDGSVWAMGNNSSGQLGDGTTTNRFTPVQVNGLSGVVAISAGDYYTVALKGDGTVWAWGANSYGQLGDGTQLPQFNGRSNPVQVSALSGVVAISAGRDHTVALKGDGSVWAWGNNFAGQLGDGTTITRLTPVQVNGLTGVTAIAAGVGHTIGMKADGSAWAWGNNRYGQLGNGTTATRLTPVQVAGLTGMVAISAGFNHTIALKGDGGVWAWGWNSDGQLGDGAQINRPTPVLVSGLTGVAAISAGDRHTLALKDDGSVWAWGNNGFGQLGDATYDSRSIPAQINGLTGVAAISAGVKHNVVLKGDGSVWAWGLNYYGQIGDGTMYNYRYSPIQVPGLNGMIAVSAGNFHTIALKGDGTVWTWGGNTYSQLGDGTTTNRATPAQVSGLTGVVAISAGETQSLALKGDGTVWAWGGSGQVGDGTTWYRSTPVQVSGLTGVVAISAGAAGQDGLGTDHSVALKSDGSVWAWGNNYYGQLGDGTTVHRLVPVQVSGLTGAAAISARGYHTAALKGDGSVLSWGDNSSGTLGDGTLVQHRTPALVVNTSLDGFLNLNSDAAIVPPPGLDVPFFVVASGTITETSASVSVTTKFNAADVGKSGAVFITAVVPAGSLVPAQSAMNAAGAGVSAATAASSLVLIQLTSSGWQPVVNGQLLPYANGVLGDALAAQTILDNADTSNLKGAAFCLGYGSSADQMIAAGTMRTVATIPDPNATGANTVNCIAGSPLSFSLVLPAGWNLLGNSLNQTLSVASLFGDVNTITSVWKWDTGTQGWQFYTPLMDATTLQTYATGKGYGVLSAINPGEGYWVNSKSQASPAAQSGSSFNLTAANLVAGWNLLATGKDVSPSAFNTDLKAGLTGTGLITLWAWDNASSRWYFYAPSLEAQGATALLSYIASKNYLDFTTANKTLGNGTGFWVNR